MTLYRIVNATSSVTLGLYHAASENDALERLAHDAGYASHAAAESAVPSAPGEVLVTNVEYELAAQISRDLAPTINAAKLAAQLLAEACIADDADSVNVEVPGRYTKTGNPISVTV